MANEQNNDNNKQEMTKFLIMTIASIVIMLIVSITLNPCPLVHISTSLRYSSLFKEITIARAGQTLAVVAILHLIIFARLFAHPFYVNDMGPVALVVPK